MLRILPIEGMALPPKTTCSRNGRTSAPNWPDMDFIAPIHRCTATRVREASTESVWAFETPALEIQATASGPARGIFR